MSLINRFCSTFTTWLATVLSSALVIAFAIRFSGRYFEVNLVCFNASKKSPSFSVFALLAENDMYWSVTCPEIKWK